jgi:putative sigma-54 modulation protein
MADFGSGRHLCRPGGSSVVRAFRANEGIEGRLQSLSHVISPARSMPSVQINIATRHGHLSAATRSKITAKVQRLSRYFERLTAIEVTVDLEHETTPIIDLRVNAEHKHDFVATEQSGDLWRSLDGAVQKLEQQLRKYKEKVQGRSRNHAVRQETAAKEA